MSRNTTLICILALSALLWAPLASARTTMTLDGEIAVPDVVGLIYIEAVDGLQGAGFSPSLLIGNLTTARITDQCPRGGTLAAPGTFVQLRIAGSISDCAGGPPPGGGGGSGGGPAASGAAAPPPTPKLVPLIFIPGIMGTEIVDNQLLFPDTKLWPQAALPGLDRLFSDLALDPNLHDRSTVNIDIRGPVLNVAGLDQYNRTVDVLQGAGYEQGDGSDATLFLFGYDWRRSVADNSSDKATQQRLAQKVRDVMSQTHRSRVDILAHSQGGLVAMTFLATHPDLVQHVRRVVTIATPILGAAKAIGIAKWARPCEFGGLNCKLNGDLMDRARDAVVNMPGVYELFPTSSYAEAVGTSPITSPDGLQLSFDRWHQILAAPDHPLNMQVLNEADGVHSSILGPFDPTGAPYKLLRIIGSGPKATPTSFREVPTKACIDLHRFCKSTTSGRESDTFYGDGTVAAPSASLVAACAPGAPLCFNHQPSSVVNKYVGGLSHMALAQDRRSLCLAITFFGARCSVWELMAKMDGSPPPDTDGIDLPNEQAPSPPTGIQVNVWGAADVSAADVAGNPVDPANSFLDEQLVSFAAPGTYSVTIRPTDSYPIKVAIQRIGADVDQRSTFFLPSPRAGQVLTLPFASDQNLADARLALDVNGDGTTDGQLAPSGATDGGSSSDATPPTTIAGGTITPAGTSSVQLLAHDDTSGVGSSYVVPSDNGPAVRYGTPFTVPLYSTVYFLSVDKQGNDEEPHAIVADDAPGYRELAAPIAVGDKLKLKRTIFPRGDEDWFRFEANGTSNYRAELEGRDGYQLELVRADGTVLQSTNRRSKERDDVRGVLSAGTYYLHVLGVGGAADREHPYKLKLGGRGTRTLTCDGGGGLAARRPRRPTARGGRRPAPPARRASRGRAG